MDCIRQNPNIFICFLVAAILADALGPHECAAGEPAKAFVEITVRYKDATTGEIRAASPKEEFALSRRTRKGGTFHSFRVDRAGKWYGELSPGHYLLSKRSWMFPADTKPRHALVGRKEFDVAPEGARVEVALTELLPVLFEGKLVYADNRQPVSGLRIDVKQVEGASLDDMLTNEEGGFRMWAYPGVEFRIKALKDPHLVKAGHLGPYTVPEKCEVPFLVEVKRPRLSLYLRVKIIDPLEGLSVDDLKELDIQDSQRNTASLKIVDGELKVYDLWPETFEVYLPRKYREAYIAEGLMGWKVTADSTCKGEIVLRPITRSALKVRLIHQGHDKPLGGALLIVRDFRRRTVGKGTTDEDGRCSFEDVPHGECSIAAQVASLPRAYLAVNHTDAPGIIELPYPRFKVIRGAVFTAEDRPVTGRCGKVSVIDIRNDRQYSTRTDEKGEYVLRHRVKSRALLVSIFFSDDLGHGIHAREIDCAAESTKLTIRHRTVAGVRFNLEITDDARDLLSERPRIALALKAYEKYRGWPLPFKGAGAYATMAEPGEYVVMLGRREGNGRKYYRLGSLSVGPEETTKAPAFVITPDTFKQEPVGP